jgi:hypothetical protein
VKPPKCAPGGNSFGFGILGLHERSLSLGSFTPG